MSRAEAVLKKFYCIYCLFSSVLISSLNSLNCPLPIGCRLERIYQKEVIEFNEKGKLKKFAIFCDVKNDEFEFKFKEPDKSVKCY